MTVLEDTHAQISRVLRFSLPSRLLNVLYNCYTGYTETILKEKAKKAQDLPLFCSEILHRAAQEFLARRGQGLNFEAQLSSMLRIFKDNITYTHLTSVSKPYPNITPEVPRCMPSSITASCLWTIPQTWATTGWEILQKSLI